MVGVGVTDDGQRRRKRDEREVKEEVAPMNERRMSRLLGKLLSILEKEDSGGNFRVLPMEGAAWAEPYRKAISPLVDFSIIRQRIIMNRPDTIGCGWWVQLSVSWMYPNAI